MVVIKLQEVLKKKKADPDFSWSALINHLKKLTATSSCTASIAFATCATAYQSKLATLITWIAFIPFKPSNANSIIGLSSKRYGMRFFVRCSSVAAVG
jgi:hypothetical protein